MSEYIWNGRPMGGGNKRMGQLLLMRTTWALCEVLTLATGPIMTLPRPGDPVITCTFTGRWVASNLVHCFQLPTANGSQEACNPQIDPASLITKCGL